MTRSRAYIGLEVKLAAALLAIEDFRFDPATGRTSRQPLIPYLHAKEMSASQIISLFAFDHHPIRKGDGGPDEPWNLVPRLIAPHRAKTAKVDVPEMAKSKRIRRKEDEHWKNMNFIQWTTDDGRLAARIRHKSHIPSRPFPKIKRPIRSNKRANKLYP